MQKNIAMSKNTEKKNTSKPAPKPVGKYGYIGGKLELPFGRENYMLLLASLGVLLIGYLLLIGGDSGDPNVFSYELFNTRRMVVAPLVLLTGFVIAFVAIMKRPKKKD